MLLAIRRREARREALDVQGPADPAETEGGVVGGPKLGLSGKAVERLEVRVPVRSDVLRALDVVEAPGEVALERHRHAEERVRDAGIAPVEEEVATVADEDLAVVEIIVLNRLGHADRRQAVAELGDRRNERAQAAALVVRDRLDAVDQLLVLTR